MCVQCVCVFAYCFVRAHVCTYVCALVCASLIDPAHSYLMASMLGNTNWSCISCDILHRRSELEITKKKARNLLIADDLLKDWIPSIHSLLSTSSNIYTRDSQRLVVNIASRKNPNLLIVPRPVHINTCNNEIASSARNGSSSGEYR